MPRAQRTVVIARPVADVFAYFADPANDQTWRTHVKEIHAEGPIGPGTHVHQVVEGPMGRGVPADYEVTAYEPGRRFAFAVIAGPVRPRGEFAFREVTDGTEVTFKLDAELTGLKKLTMSGAVQKSMDAEANGLDRARELLEA